MSFQDFIKLLQRTLNSMGEKLTIDGDPGSYTKAALEKYDVVISLNKKPVVEPPPLTQPSAEPVNPAYVKAKEYAGKQETDKSFGAWLSGFWSKLGLNYKTIIGSSFAWCGLFVFAMNTQVGQQAVLGAASAKSWAKYGVEVDWKKDGIPKGAVVHYNHAGNCSSSADNHVDFADGDCAPQDLIQMVKTSTGSWIASTNPPQLKPGATMAGFGGNQSNQVKRSIYSVKEICEVRWPSELQKPGTILKSVNCTGTPSAESTQ
jgi:hypothetical protein